MTNLIVEFVPREDWEGEDYRLIMSWVAKTLEL